MEHVMRTLRLSLLSAVAFAASTPALAERQTAVGPGSIPLSAIGVLGGVDMSGSATTGTLIVGVVGGPAMDIFTLNNPALPGRVAISTAASSQGNIVFNSSSTVYGDIGVTQPGGPFLLDIKGAGNGAAVDFMGPVFATTVNVTGTGAMNFNSGSINVAATNFAGDGTIYLAPKTTVIGAMTTTAGAKTGTLLLSGGSTLDGAVGGAIGLKAINVVGGSNLAGVTANITGAVDAFAFSLGTNTLKIGGALTIANIGTSGVINTTLASTSVYGNIRPVGSANLGPSLLVNVTVAPSAYIPVGSQFNIVDATSGTNGSVINISVQNPTNPLYKFKAVPLGGTIGGLVRIEATGTPLLVPIAPPAGVPLPTTLPTAAAVVPVLIAVTPTPDLISVLAPINAISDAASVVTAISQLAPSSTDGAAALVTFNGTRQLQYLSMARLASIACDLDSSVDVRLEKTAPMCTRPERRGGLWMQGYGYFSKQDSQLAVAGYNASIGGVFLGWDAPIGAYTHAGAGLGYARSNIRSNESTSRTEFDSYQITAYVGHEPGPWFINGALSLGASDYSGTRDIVFPGVSRHAAQKYNGQSYTAIATTGWHMRSGDFAATPLASIQYTRVDLDGYTETGAGDINLRIKSRSYEFVESTLGLRLSKNIHYSGGVWVPEVHAKWLHELKNPGLSQVAAFDVAGSQSFVVPGLKVSDNTLNVGAGITLASCGCTAHNWSFSAGYDYYRAGSGSTAHQANVKLTTRF
jgi:outer membrane autotransporter protein